MVSAVVVRRFRRGRCWWVTVHGIDPDGRHYITAMPVQVWRTWAVSR